MPRRSRRCSGKSKTDRGNKVKIPVYVRSSRETIQECVAVAQIIKNATYVEAMLVGPVSLLPASEMPINTTRLAVIHQFIDGNRYAQEVVSPSEYVEALNFWTKVFKLNIREHQPITGYCGWLTSRN